MASLCWASSSLQISQCDIGAVSLSLTKDDHWNRIPHIRQPNLGHQVVVILDFVSIEKNDDVTRS
jgi:hypothetical protein